MSEPAGRRFWWCGKAFLVACLFWLPQVALIWIYFEFFFRYQFTYPGSNAPPLESRPADILFASISYGLLGAGWLFGILLTYCRPSSAVGYGLILGYVTYLTTLLCTDSASPWLAMSIAPIAVALALAIQRVRVSRGIISNDDRHAKDIP